MRDEVVHQMLINVDEESSSEDKMGSKLKMRMKKTAVNK
jgi:hypothetical protein